MNTIVTVFRKELLDTLRDRRTIMFMIVIPLLLFPVLFRVMFTVQKSHSDRERARTLRVAVLDRSAARGLAAFLAGYEGIEIVPGVPEDSLRSFVRADSLDGAFVVDAGFDAAVERLGSGGIEFYFKSTEDRRIARRRLRAVLDGYQEQLLERRFAALGLDRSVTEVIDVRSRDVTTAEEQIGSEIGGFLPYVFILFCFLGAMYPAIDLGAGEKERGTMETLLTAPVNRFDILLGKFGVVVLSGLISATVSIVGLYLAVRQAPELPPEFFDVVIRILGWKSVIQIFSLLLPLTIFFAGILLSLSLTARSFKEAQSVISPLNIAVIVPAAIGMVPGVEMGYATALVPVLNVSLATREIVAGTMSTSYLAVVYVSLVLFALGSLALAAAWFSRESTIFRA